MREPLMRSSSHSRRISWRRLLFSAFSRMRALMLFAATPSGLSRNLSVRESHLPQECRPARVCVQRPEVRLGLQHGKARVALRIGSLQPFEGGIRLASSRVCLCDLVPRLDTMHLDEFPQSPI